MDNSLATVFLALMYAAFFLAGFLIGKNTDKLEETVKTGLTDFEKAYRERGHSGPKEISRVGAIPAPTAREIYLRDNPEIGEETEEMSKAFEALKVKEE